MSNNIPLFPNAEPLLLEAVSGLTIVYTAVDARRLMHHRNALEARLRNHYGINTLGITAPQVLQAVLNAQTTAQLNYMVSHLTIGNKSLVGRYRTDNSGLPAQYDFNSSPGVYLSARWWVNGQPDNRHMITGIEFDSAYKPCRLIHHISADGQQKIEFETNASGEEFINFSGVNIEASLYDEIDPNTSYVIDVSEKSPNRVRLVPAIGAPVDVARVFNLKNLSCKIDHPYAEYDSNCGDLRTMFPRDLINAFRRTMADVDMHNRVVEDATRTFSALRTVRPMVLKPPVARSNQRTSTTEEPRNVLDFRQILEKWATRPSSTPR